MEKIQEKFNIKCSYCSYEWFTKSKLNWVTCPNCRHITKNKNGNIY